MNVDFIETKNNCPIAIVDNFFVLSELTDIKKELIPLYEIGKLGIYNNHGVFKDEEQKPTQKSCSLFVDDLFQKDRTLSKILSINRKLFTDIPLKESLIQKSLFYSYIYESNKDSTLINFYSSTDFYKPHKDIVSFTALTFFELKPFTGGDLLFPEYGIKIKPLENRMVIFPGFLMHSAEEVKSGIRVSMAQFVNTV